MTNLDNNSTLIADVAHNASAAAKTAADTASAVAVLSNDVAWIKKSFERVEITLNEMNKAFVTAAQHAEVIKAVENQGSRINVLETERTRITALLAVGAFLLTILLGILVKHVIG